MRTRSVAWASSYLLPTIRTRVATNNGWKEQELLESDNDREVAL